ncbi:hypothetical protein [uncultured Litoreibacter sp.]|uniref:hypothetical protein n=1 Tax=uncultured Litoreibacter sp. TaxID=1392394 RepID=UPI002638107D|nr:hypothetical protein [uncultured Litoreibacter sp.]
MVYTYYHLFVIAWNRGGSGASGLKMTFSAFPSHDGNPSVWGAISGASTSDSSKQAEEGHKRDPSNDADMGYIKPEIAPDYYTSGEVALGNKFVTIRDTNANYVPKLLAASSQIGMKRIKYDPTGPNSNSYAMSIVRKAKLPDRKPAVTAPGAGMQLI